MDTRGLKLMSTVWNSMFISSLFNVINCALNTVGVFGDLYWIASLFRIQRGMQAGIIIIIINYSTIAITIVGLPVYQLLYCIIIIID